MAPAPRPSNSPIPAELLVNVVQGSVNTSRLEVATILLDGMYQDDAVWQPSQLPKNAEAPQGWQWVDRYGKPSARKTTHDSKVQGKPADYGFGPASKDALTFPVPKGFTLITTRNADDGTDKAKSSGYDAVALYNPINRELIIANHGRDDGSAKDLAAVKADGGDQINSAQQFLTDVLKQLPYPPAHITLAGHSLGGVLADAQAVKLLHDHSNVPFHVVTIDSIGSHKYIQGTRINAVTVEAVKQHTLAIDGKGTFSGVSGFFYPLYAATHGLPSWSSVHMFADNFAKGAAHIHYNVNHDMGDGFTPNILANVQQQLGTSKKR